MIPEELPDDLASIRHINTYRIPAGYFESLADDIMSQIRLSQISEMPYSAPPALYFESLSGSILSRIKEEDTHFYKTEVQTELEEIEPSLAILSNKNIYSVPDGYFNSFEVKIPTTIERAPARKIVSIGSWMKYAVAAVIAGIIATGIIIFAGNNQSSLYGANANIEQALAKVPDNDIYNYLDKSASTDIDITPVFQESNNVKSSEGLMKTLLNNVSDNDIQQYLKENSDGNENDIKGI